MINVSSLTGRLTRDPELRRTGNGNAVASFTVAVNRGYQSSDGQQADYIPCVVWNKPAENVAKYCSKGSLVGIVGRLQSRSYTNSEGKNVFVLEVVCDSVSFLESKKSMSGDNAGQSGNRQYQQNSGAQNRNASQQNGQNGRTAPQNAQQNSGADEFSLDDFDINF